MVGGAMVWILMAACGGGAARAPVIEVGAPAPALALPRAGSDEVLRWAPAEGLTVVEWLVPSCIYADDVHGPGGALDTLPDAVGAEGGRWWSVVVGGSAAEAVAAAEAWGLPGPVLHDADGAAAAAWGVRSGPQAMVLDAAGVVRYHGAIDNQPLRQAGDRMPYLADAVEAVRDGGRAPVPRSRPYGCPVR